MVCPTSYLRHLSQARSLIMGGLIGVRWSARIRHLRPWHVHTFMPAENMHLIIIDRHARVSSASSRQLLKEDHFARCKSCCRPCLLACGVGDLQNHCLAHLWGMARIRCHTGCASGNTAIRCRLRASPYMHCLSSGLEQCVNQGSCRHQGQPPIRGGSPISTHSDQAGEHGRL